jgi:hypothetical protein
MGLACHTRPSIVTSDRRNIIEREFGDEYRDAHFPSGWYVLPLVGAGALTAVLLGLLL